MKKLVVLTSAFFGLVTLANTSMAADTVALDPEFNWSGPYVGVQGGYGWQSNNDLDEIFTATGVVNQAFEFDDDGYFGGFHAGYNLTSGSLVYGVEGDIEYANIASEGLGGGGSDSLDKEIDWQGSLRLRAGVSIDRALLYVTGGLAAGIVDMEAFDPPSTTVSNTDLAFGWTAGAGLEFAISDSLSASVEYRYTDLENTENSGTIFNGDFTYDHENKLQTVRAGLSWHF